MQLRRQIGISLAALLIVVAIIYGFMPKPVAVDVMPVARATLQVTVEEEGRTRVIDRYAISAPVAGYAQRIELDVGDSVQQGQPLVALEPLPSTVLDPRSRAQAQAQVAGAEAALLAAQENATAARASHDFAKAEYERIKELCKTQCVSQTEEDKAAAEARRAAANLRSARFAVEVARHELEAAKTTLQYSAAKGSQTPDKVVITSPINGSVLKINRESEGVIAVGQTLIEVGNPRALEVVVEALSADAVRMAPGTRIRFARWGGEQDLEGVVRVVEPVGFTKVSALGVEEQRVLVIADITSPTEQWQRLGDGYRVEASFILWEEPDVLQIPASSLFRYQDGWAVFVMQNDRAVRKVVEIGQRNGLSAQVLAGLKQGELVITHPDDSIEDGVEVYQR
jgi:HlyD family secretion protein